MFTKNQKETEVFLLSGSDEKIHVFGMVRITKIPFVYRKKFAVCD